MAYGAHPHYPDGGSPGVGTGAFPPSIVLHDYPNKGGSSPPKMGAQSGLKQQPQASNPMLNDAKPQIDPARRGEAVKELGADARTDTGMPGALATMQQIAERRTRALADLLEEAIRSGSPRALRSHRRR